MKIVLLDAKTLGGDIDLSVLDRFGTLEIYSVTAESLTAARIKNADIVISNKVVIDREILDAAPLLKLICVAATGMNNVDLEAAAARGIAVKNVAGYSTESVVQITFSHAMYLLNRHAYFDNYSKTSWRESDIFTHLAPPFYELSGKRWGIVGLGTIGRRIAQVAAAFGCEVVYFSTSGKNKTTDYPCLQLNDLLKSSHIISIHAPLNADTKNLIDYKKLLLIRNGGIILNMGRGGIVNEPDLARILDERSVFAGVDVVTQEPISGDNPLLGIKHMERLSVTPHIAWASTEARQRLVDGIVENIETFLSESDMPLERG